MQVIEDPRILSNAKFLQKTPRRITLAGSALAISVNGQGVISTLVRTGDKGEEWDWLVSMIWTRVAAKS